jgi:hypothetical protein
MLKLPGLALGFETGLNTALPFSADCQCTSSGISTTHLRTRVDIAVEAVDLTVSKFNRRKYRFPSRMNRVQHIKLPVGDKPGWELCDSDENTSTSGLKSIAERCPP